MTHPTAIEAAAELRAAYDERLRATLDEPRTPAQLADELDRIGAELTGAAGALPVHAGKLRGALRQYLDSFKAIR